MAGMTALIYFCPDIKACTSSVPNSRNECSHWTLAGSDVKISRRLTRSMDLGGSAYMVAVGLKRVVYQAKDEWVKTIRSERRVMLGG